MIAKTLTALALTAVALGHGGRLGPVAINVEVDCAAGDDLAAALQRASNNPGTNVLISGTCTGNFVVDADRVRLNGIEPGAALAAPPDGDGQPVLWVRNAESVRVRDLAIRGGSLGVRFTRSPGGLVFRSEIELNEVGIYIEESQGVTVQDCDVHDNEIGVYGLRHTRFGVSGSTIRDNTRLGLVVWEHSTLGVGNTEIRGNGDVGIEVRIVSELTLGSSTLAENGDIHLFVDDRSKIQVVSGVVVGSATDSTGEAVHVDDNSTFFAGTADYYGTVRVWGRSYAELGNVLQGTVVTEQFSRTFVFNTQLAVPATCASGGDLVCEGSATATTTGCPAAVASCATAAAAE